ncbi:mesotocin receptor-like [Pelobates fuscus]|uniref:mesotocin receptor-like n=1 Tax=Pelobates fuscus TaxID=191477 RepID=UPI002FE4B111
MKNCSFLLQEKYFQTETPLSNSEKNMSRMPDSNSRADRDEQLAHIEIAILVVIFLIASVGNLTLILVLWQRRKKLSRMHVFMLHLSFADLVVAFFQVFPQLIWDITDVFIGPDPVCRIVKYLQVVGMFASTYMIVVMTVDRFQAICYPMVTFQKKRSLWNAGVSTSWCISFIFSIPQLFIFSKSEISPGISECWAEFILPWGPMAYVTWIFIVIFFIPVVTLTVCQIQICRTIQMNIYVKKHIDLERRDQPQSIASRASSINCISKAMIKTVKMSLVTVFAYVLCWTPFFIVQLWAVWFPSSLTENAVFTIVMLLGSLNSCVNPWIYMYFCGHIPQCIKKVKHLSMHYESAITASINLRDRDCDEKSTFV